VRRQIERPAKLPPSVLSSSFAGWSRSIAGFGVGAFQCLGEALGELAEAVGEHVAGEFEVGVVFLVGDWGDETGVHHQLVADLQQFVVGVCGQAEAVVVGRGVVLAFHGGLLDVAARTPCAKARGAEESDVVTA
jgi:hypothetical protein